MWGVTEELLKVECRGVRQDLIPYVWLVELAIVLTEGWITDPDVHSLCYGPGGVVCFPDNYGDIVHSDVMTSDVGMVVGEGRGPKVFLKLFS